MSASYLRVVADRAGDRPNAGTDSTAAAPAGGSSATAVIATTMRADLAVGRLTMAEYAREARAAGVPAAEIASTLKQHAAAKEASFMEGAAAAGAGDAATVFPAGTYYGRLHTTAVKVVDGIFVPAVTPPPPEAASKEAAESLAWLREHRPWGARAAERLGPENDFLVELELSDQGRGGRVADGQVDAEGARHLARALRVNDVLTSLQLADNALGVEGASHLAGALSANGTLTELGLAGNGLGDAGAAALAAMLEQNRALTSLDVAENQLTQAAVERLRAAWGGRDAARLHVEQ